jgi:hypothetical protein
MVVNATPDETTAAAPAPSTPPPEFEKLSRENLAFVVALLRRFGVPPSGLREACQRALPEDPCDSFGTGDHRTARCVVDSSRRSSLGAGWCTSSRTGVRWGPD